LFGRRSARRALARAHSPLAGPARTLTNAARPLARILFLGYASLVLEDKNQFGFGRTFLDGNFLSMNDREPIRLRMREPICPRTIFPLRPAATPLMALSANLLGATAVLPRPTSRSRIRKPSCAK